MVKCLLVSLYENREKYGIIDVVMDSSLLDMNFLGMCGVAELRTFLDNHEVDRLTIKLKDFTRSFEVHEIKRINLNGHEIIITMTDDSIFTLREV